MEKNKNKFESMVKKVKGHPILTNTVTLASAVTILFSVVFLFDDRYAHAENFNDLKESIKEVHKNYSQETRSIRKSMLIQARMKKTVLITKKHNKELSLSAREEVELEGLKQQIETLKDHKRKK